MNVAAFNVVAMNIHHIIECSLHDSAMLDIIFLSVSNLVFDFVHKFCCVTAHDEVFQNKPVLGDALTQVSPFYRE